MHKVYPWQQQQWQQMTLLANRQQLPHALLLYGLKGLGKNAFAAALTNYLLCDNSLGTQESCGSCSACKLVQAGTHPDVTIIQSAEDSRVIKVDQIRQMSEFIYDKSYAGKYKIALITPAEEMNLAAANALLKMLEEPAAEVLILLVANNIQWLPPTIRSRCQNIYFPPVTFEQFKDSSSSSEPDVVARNYALSYGAPLKINETTDGELFALRIKLYDHLLELMSHQLTPIKLAQTIHTQELSDITDLLLAWICDAINIALNTPSALLINQDKIESLRKFSQSQDLIKMYQIYDKLLDVKNNLKRSLNMNKQLWLEELFIELQNKSPNPLSGERRIRM